jgi:hypothetical protein
MGAAATISAATSGHRKSAHREAWGHAGRTAKNQTIGSAIRPVAGDMAACFRAFFDQFSTREAGEDPSRSLIIHI